MRRPWDYLCSFLTNELVSKMIYVKERDHLNDFYRGSDDYPLYDEGRRIREFDSYSFGNHIGVSIVGVTIDHFVVFWRQSDSAMESSRLLAPTGSGSCDSARCSP